MQFCPFRPLGKVRLTGPGQRPDRFEFSSFWNAAPQQNSLRLPRCVIGPGPPLTAASGIQGRRRFGSHASPGAGCSSGGNRPPSSSHNSPAGNAAAFLHQFCTFYDTAGLNAGLNAPGKRSPSFCEHRPPTADNSKTAAIDTKPTANRIPHRTGSLSSGREEVLRTSTGKTSTGRRWPASPAPSPAAGAPAGIESGP